MAIARWDDDESGPPIIMSLKSIPLEKPRWNITVESPTTWWNYNGNYLLIIMLLFGPFHYNIPLYYIKQFLFIIPLHYSTEVESPIHLLFHSTIPLYYTSQFHYINPLKYKV
jgi:hypothetical protein